MSNVPDVDLVSAISGLLDKGQVKVSLKDLGLDKKPDIVEALKSREFATEQPKGKLTLQKSGFEFWQRHANPNEQQPRFQSYVTAFLKSLKESGDQRKFAAKDLAAHPETWLTELVNQGYALLSTEGKGKSLKQVYTMGAAGQRLLEAVEQVARRQRIQSVLAELQRDHANLAVRMQQLPAEVSQMSAEGISGFATIADGIRAQLDRASAEMTQALTELGGMVKFAELAGELRANILREAESILAKAEQEHRSTKEATTQLSVLRSSFDAFHQRFQEKIDSVESDLSALKSAPTVVHVEAPPPPKARMSDDEMMRTFREVHQQLSTDHPLFGGSIKIPMLFAAMRERGGVEKIEDFHAFLKQQAAADKIELRVCNDPNLESEPEKGIPSGHGLLFYVRLR